MLRLESSFVLINAKTDILLLQVVFYGDPFCSFNATRAPVVKPLGSCTSSDHLFSFAVECGPDASTSSKATASPQATSSQTASSVSVPASTPEVTSEPAEQSAAPGSGNNGGLGTSGTIAIGVVLPAVSIIVAIIFGIRMWNSGFNSRKANGFTELPMDIRTGNPPPPPPAPPLRSDGSCNGFTESGPFPLKEAGGNSVNPFEPEPPSPIGFGAPPRYKTDDPGLMSAASIGQPRQEQETVEHGSHSITPTGYAELSTGNYPSTPGGAAEFSTSSLEGFTTTSLFAAQPSRRTDPHLTTRRNATRIPTNPTVGAGQSSAPTEYTELPANSWEGHNSSAQQGGLAELPAPPAARWR